MEAKKDENGKYPSYGWPGGYPVIYICRDSGVLCPDCANGENGSDATVNNDDPQWDILGMDIYWEGPALQCDHCNADIESAYGDPETS